MKIACFRQRYNVAESGQVLQLGYMGEIFTRCRIWLNFCTRVCLKRSNDWGEFELDRAKSKNDIAENSVTPGHETHNTSPAAGQADGKVYSSCLISTRKYERMSGIFVPWLKCSYSVASILFFQVKTVSTLKEFLLKHRKDYVNAGR